MKKVLIITYYFPPAGGAGVQRWLKFVKYLPQYGCEPIVLTVDEKFASYPQTDFSLVQEIPENVMVVKTKTREVLSAYKKLSPGKQVPYGGFANERNPGLFQKIARFIRGNFFLPDPRKAWNRFALPEAVRIIRELNVDTVITTGPPHSTHLLGIALKKKFSHIRWIADLRDPWSDIYYNNVLYQTSLAKKINLSFERRVLAIADSLVTVSETVKKNFCSHAPVENKFHVIPNGYDASDFSDVTIGNREADNRLVISYIGTLSPLYETETFVSALKNLSPEIISKISLRMIGDVNSEITAELSKTSVEIEYLPYQQHSSAIRYMRDSDLLLLLLPKTSGEGVLTGKFFEYLAAERPIILVQPVKSEVGEIINTLGAGKVFDSGQSDELAKYIESSCRVKPSVNVIGVERFSREKLTEKLAEMICSNSQ